MLADVGFRLQNDHRLAGPGQAPGHRQTDDAGADHHAAGFFQRQGHGLALPCPFRFNVSGGRFLAFAVVHRVVVEQIAGGLVRAPGQIEQLLEGFRVVAGPVLLRLVAVQLVQGGRFAVAPGARG